MSTNKAAWIIEAKSKPLVVKEAPYPTPAAGEVIVKNVFVAINPIDHKIQDRDLFKSEYPSILGSEVAGEIVAVGDGVQGLNVGQRVTGFCHANMTRNPRNAGFQNYTVLLSALVTPIPDSLGYEAAVVLPVGISTASAALFQKDSLSLLLPSLSPTSTPDSVVLVWGGSSSVGCSTIQLARAAGVEVFTTASQHNFEQCKTLGASQAFDRNSTNVVAEIVAALKGKSFLGVVNAIGDKGTMEACVETVVKSGAKVPIVTTQPIFWELDKKGVDVKNVFALSILKSAVGEAIWKSYLPQALEQGRILPMPDSLVVGTGLDSIQKALDRARDGYSAKKLVVKVQIE